MGCFQALKSKACMTDKSKFSWRMKMMNMRCLKWLKRENRWWCLLKLRRSIHIINREQLKFRKFWRALIKERHLSAFQHHHYLNSNPYLCKATARNKANPASNKYSSMHASSKQFKQLPTKAQLAIVTSPLILASRRRRRSLLFNSARAMMIHLTKRSPYLIKIILKGRLFVRDKGG